MPRPNGRRRATQVRTETAAKRDTGGVSLHLAAHTDIGLVRERNEDSFVVVDLATGREGVPVRSMGRVGAMMAVCDGLGGSAGGDVASRTAATTLAEWIRTATGAVTDVGSAAALLRTGILEANRRIFAESHRTPDLLGMGTTVTAAIVHDRWLVYAQVGDSRLYLARGAQFVQLTRDQSLVVALTELGLLSSQQASALRGLNILLQAVGTEERVEIATCCLPLRRGDLLLLCSDGLTAVVPDEEIAVMLRSKKKLSTVAADLVQRARAGGGPDNITLIVARVAGVGLEASRDERIVPEVIR